MNDPNHKQTTFYQNDFDAEWGRGIFTEQGRWEGVRRVSDIEYSCDWEVGSPDPGRGCWARRQEGAAAAGPPEHCGLRSWQGAGMWGEGTGAKTETQSLPTCPAPALHRRFWGCPGMRTTRSGLVTLLLSLGCPIPQAPPLQGPLTCFKPAV